MNQFILGNGGYNNPYMDDLDVQIAKSKEYQQRLMQLKQNESTPIWDKIDSIINGLTDTQKNKLMQDKEYINIYNQIQSILWKELICLVKSKVENNNKELLNKQYEILMKTKSRFIEQDNVELNLFNEFKEYSKTHPNSTYSDFLNKKQ